MLIDRRNLATHRPWIALAVIITIASSVWFFTSSMGVSQWPGGSSPPGLTFGILGGLLILFEFALWGRKKMRRTRIGRVQTWMAAHIWLGLVTVPLLVYHSGFRWGGQLSAVLMVLFLVVIASGVWGLILQQIIPSKMLNNVPAETIHSQIDRMFRFMYDDGLRLVKATCGPLPGEDADEVSDQQAEEGMPIGHMTVGAIQTVGSVQGKVLVTRVPKAAVAGAEPLRELYRNSIGPYLLKGKKAQPRLALANKAKGIFDEIRVKLPRDAKDAVDILENLCDQRRQLDRQKTYHFWLHNWLIVHLPLSVALVVLMFFHIWVAFKYR